ncbi:MAG: response regulator [Patescibacteria group bacterium]
MTTEKKFRILIVDDDAFIQNMYVTKFTKSGHEIIVAKNGQEALARLKDETLPTPDAVLLDVVLPGMDGLQILAQARQENLAPSAKYIMLTNQADEAEVEGAKKLGVAGFIVKAAVTPSEVVTKVLEILGAEA